MKTRIAIAIVALIPLLSGCGFSSALIVNQNQNVTHVNLGSNNFKVVGSVTGSSEVDYILMIGGLHQTQLYNNAYADMAAKADLQNGARALINVAHEEHVGGFPPFYYTRTITISAKIIEFTK